MPEPVNDISKEHIVIKIAMVFFTLVGLAGGSMSIAGPVVGLTLNPNDLTATNFKQVERFGLEAALYFDCDKVDTAFGQNMVQQMVATMNDTSAILNTQTDNDSDHSRTTTTDTFERLCNDRKGSHLYIAITSGVFTYVGMLVFIACGVVKKFEPDFVYIVPMLLSLVMIYDFVETNSSMFAYIKRCTESASNEDDDKDKTKNLIMWAPYANGTMGRYGVTEFGQTCKFEFKEDKLTGRDAAFWAPYAPGAAGNLSGTNPEIPVFPPNGPCRPDLADDIILCTYFYSCQQADKDHDVRCKNINFRESLATVDRDHDQEDKACNDLGEGLTVWILGAIFNVIANGMMLSALAIRRNRAQFADPDYKEMVATERAMISGISATAE